MVSLDKSILEPQSEAAGRMKLYGTICEELHILVLKGTGNPVRISENVFAYSCGASLKFLAVFHAVKAGKKILCSDGKWIITCQDPFITSMVGWLLAKKFKNGLEIQIHGDFYGNPYWRKEKFINNFFWLFGKYILRKASVVRVVSERIKKSIAAKKIFVLPISPNFGAVSGNPNFLKEKFPGAYPILLSAGSLIPVKNHKFLIEVFAGIKKELPRAKLVIAGDGPLLEKLKVQISKFKLEHDVWLAGHQNNLSDFYASADIFVHPSLSESWGRAVVEAAAAGLPIIMSDVGLAGEVIKNNESGLVAPAQDFKAFRKAIIQLAENKSLQADLANGAKEAVKKLPDREAALRVLKDSWEQVARFSST